MALIVTLRSHVGRRSGIGRGTSAPLAALTPLVVLLLLIPSYSAGSSATNLVWTAPFTFANVSVQNFTSPTVATANDNATETAPAIFNSSSGHFSVAFHTFAKATRWYRSPAFVGFDVILRSQTFHPLKGGLQVFRVALHFQWTLDLKEHATDPTASTPSAKSDFGAYVTLYDLTTNTSWNTVSQNTTCYSCSWAAPSSLTTVDRAGFPLALPQAIPLTKYDSYYFVIGFAMEVYTWSYSAGNSIAMTFSVGNQGLGTAVESVSVK